MTSHVAVFTFPSSSHPAALLLLTKLLANLAPDVLFTVFTTTNTKNNASADTTTTQPNIRHFNFSLSSSTDTTTTTTTAKRSVYEELILYMNSAPSALRKAVADAEAETGKKFTTVLSDSFLWFVADIADEMVVPWIATYISGTHQLAIHVYTDLIRERIGVHEKAELLKDECLNFIPGVSTIRVKDLLSGVVTGNLESVYADITYQMGRVLPQRASVVIANSFEELNPELTSHLRSNLNGRFLCIGPFALITTTTTATPHLPPPSSASDPHGCIPWLDRQPPQSVIYIAFGTVASPTASETAAIASAIEEVGVGFLWSMKEEKMSDLPDTFVMNMKNNNKGLIVPWCPQIEVLKLRAVGASMTHFGWGSVMESLNEGVPLIGRPFVGDNCVIARLAEAEWGVGVVAVKEEEGGVFTKDGLVRALEKVMKDGEDRERIMGNAREFKERIGKAVGIGGSSRVNLDTLVKIVAQNPLEST